MSGQLLFVIGAYFVSPRELDWHVRWSWERIVRQLMPAVAVLAIFAIRSTVVTINVDDRNERA